MREAIIFVIAPIIWGVLSGVAVFNATLNEKYSVAVAIIVVAICHTIAGTRDK